MNMALRCGGHSRAMALCTIPPCEAPTVPTLPFDQGCRAAHSTVSYPSFALVDVEDVEILTRSLGLAPSSQILNDGDVSSPAKIPRGS